MALLERHHEGASSQSARSNDQSPQSRLEVEGKDVGGNARSECWHDPLRKSLFFPPPLLQGHGFSSTHSPFRSALRGSLAPSASKRGTIARRLSFRHRERSRIDRGGRRHSIDSTISAKGGCLCGAVGLTLLVSSSSLPPFFAFSPLFHSGICSAHRREWRRMLVRPGKGARAELPVRLEGRANGRLSEVRRCWGVAWPYSALRACLLILCVYIWLLTSHNLSIAYLRTIFSIQAPGKNLFPRLSPIQLILGS